MIVSIRRLRTMPVRLGAKSSRLGALLLLVMSLCPLAYGDSGSYRQVEPNRYAGGQPSSDDLKALKEQGVRHIISLRTPGEVAGGIEGNGQAEGMNYHHIPVAGAAGVTVENAMRLDALLAEIGDEPVLLHCASGNRVGALIALRAGLAGSDPEEALQEGREWGLTSLEGVVRQRLERLPGE